MEVITETVTAKDTQIDVTVTLPEAESKPDKPEFKSYTVKAQDVKLQDSQFRGIAAFMGNVDQGEDVIAPGAFSKALPEFLRSGFVPIGHDWYEKPVAMPTSAQEDGNKLIIEAQFHSTPSAQEARTIMTERLEKGLDVGLSIGFDIESAHDFEDGEKLLTFAKDNGYDLKLFDQAGIKAHKTRWGLRLITKIRRLFEVSIVSVPMNPLAVATAAKAHGLYKVDVSAIKTEREFEEFLRDAGFPVSFAKTIASTGYKALRQRDVEETATLAVSTEEAPAAETVEVKTEDEPPVTPTPTEAPREMIYFTAAGRRLEWMH